MEKVNPAAILGTLGGRAVSEAKARTSAQNGKLGGRPIVPLLNEDGISIAGCNFIYAPKGQAGEYAPLACNPYRGCGHMCAYCYVPAAIKISREEFNLGAVARRDFLSNLQKDAKKYKTLNSTAQVLLSFTSDVYHPGDTTLTRSVISMLQQHGLGVCVLTKGGTRALRDIDLYRHDRDCFAATLTSLDDSFSKKWEPGAALPRDRIAALKEFYSNGIFTWVSLEPTLNTESSLEIISETHNFVNLFKIGRVNYLPITKTTDWESYTNNVITLCNKLGAPHYIKKDLQRYLPAGYNNPLRIKQHHGQ